MKTKLGFARAVEQRAPNAEQHPRGLKMLLVRSMFAGNPPRLVVRCEGAEQPVRFVVGTRGKVDLVYVAAVAAIPDKQAPQPIDRDGTVVCISELVDEFAAHGVDDVDPAISKVADEQIACELPKAGRCERQTPWGVEPAAGRQSLEQVAIGIEDINVAIPRACHIVLTVGVLLGVGHVEFAS